MTDTIRTSVNAALTQVEKELKQAGLAQQKPATDALNKATDTAKTMIHEMRREMSRYTWKSAIYLVLTIFFVLAVCVAAFTWFMNDGYSQIAEMQRMEAVWQKKAPLANISQCDGKTCIQVKGGKHTNNKGDVFYIIK